MKSDANGFLIADRAISVESLSAAMKGVKGDTSAILALLKVGARAAVSERARVLNSGANRAQAQEARGYPTSAPRAAARDEGGKSLARVAAALSRERDERGRFLPVTTELTAVAQAVKDMTRQQAAQHAEEKREREKRQRYGRDESGQKDAPSANTRRAREPGASAAPAASSNPNSATSPANNPNATDTQARAANGRFVGKGGGAAAAGGDDSGGEGGNAGGGRAKRTRDGESFFSRMKGLLSGAKAPGNMHLGTGELEKVDPTVEAGKELGNIVKAPLQAVGAVGKAVVGRGFSAASKLPAAPWYRRILKELHLFRGESGAFASTETRVLKEIERKTGGGAKGEGRGLLASLAGGAGMLGGLLKGGGGRLLGGLFKGGKGLLKRLPLLGALFAGGSALASIFGADDPNKTPEQNRTARFEGAGSGIGAIVGGALGTFFGPVGTMIGGVIGDRVGELVGNWLSTVDWSKVGATITGAWDTTVGFFKDSWKTVTDKLGEITKTVSETWTGITTAIKSFLKDKFGVDVDALMAKAADLAKPVVDKARQVGGAVADVAKKGAEAVGNYVSDRAQKMAAPIARTGGAVMDWGQKLYGKLDRGYRHHEDFSGFKGADGISKNGSYTNDEAEKIRQLKASGANTSANIGGMPADVRDKIVAAALKNGLDPKAMLEFAAMESGGNANAISGTGAIGIYQFTGKTATGVGIKDRFDVDQNISGGMKLAQENAAVLQKAGLPVNAANLYMLHQLGPAAGKEVIQGAASGKSTSQLSPETQKAMGMNVGAGSGTAADYLAKNAAALDSRGRSVVGDMSQLTATVPVQTVAQSAPPPPAPIPPAPPSPAPTPPVQANIPQPMNSQGPVDVRVSGDKSIGQDLGDKRLAQIATGGIAV